jgi:hypothetical protein
VHLIKFWFSVSQDEQRRRFAEHPHPRRQAAARNRRPDPESGRKSRPDRRQRLGKSSLFALLRNELQPDAGDAFFPAAWRVAHVAQETPALDRRHWITPSTATPSAPPGSRTGGGRSAATTATASANCTPRWPMPTPTRCARAANNCSPAWAFRTTR